MKQRLEINRGSHTPRPAHSPVSVQRFGRRVLSPAQARPAEAWRELARLTGIELAYRDTAGLSRSAAPETVKAILKLLDAPADTRAQARDSLRQLALRTWRHLLDPVLIAWDGRPAPAPLRIPDSVSRSELRCFLHLEDGSVRSLDCHLGPTRILERAEIDGKSFICHQLSLPSLPLGYHWLEMEVQGRRGRALLISAPRRCYSSPAAARDWGLFVPMYALRSRQSWGAGNLRDWRRLVDWSASVGARITATLPLLAGFLDVPFCEPSPYSPVSRLAWNEFYLDLESIREFKASPCARRLVASPAFQRELQRFRAQPLLDYSAQNQCRRRVLELMARAFFAQPSPRRTRFDAFLAANPRVADYARFRAAVAATGTDWRRWPERMRHGKLQPGDFSPTAEAFFLYSQWVAHEQFGATAAYCRERGVQLYLDMPIGVGPESYDVWRERDSFAISASVGAPPDAFFTKGQDWGFAPLHPARNRQRYYQYVRECLRFQFRHTGLLRLDHIMGLHRLYWIPQGSPPDQGAYVSYPAEELYAILALESHRHRTVVAGENLGTVPPEVTEAMDRHGVRQLYVTQYEVRAKRERKPERGRLQPALRDPPRQSVASLNTHDMPPFAAWWHAEDISDQLNLGLLKSAELTAARRKREQTKAALIDFLRRVGRLQQMPPQPMDVFHAAQAWLAAGPAEFVIINLEDLWLETLPQNVPGTWRQRPNWRRQTRWTLEELEHSRDLRSWLTQITRLRRPPRSPRTGPTWQSTRRMPQSGGFQLPVETLRRTKSR